GADAQPDDPPPACAGAGAARGIRAPESRQAASVARRGAVLENAAEHSPRRAGARRAYRGGARRDRLFGRRDRRAARRRRLRAGAAVMSGAVLRRLLDANERFDLANRGTVNHLPMALYALSRLGASDDRLEEYFGWWEENRALPR